MSPSEIREALESIAREAGPDAYASVDVRAFPYSTNGPVSAVLYPTGVASGTDPVRVNGDTFADVIDKLTRAWEARRTLQDKHTTRKMALTIIEVTTDQGECSDAALRGYGFSQYQIDAMGEAACAEATRLAAGGPFSIVPTIGANAKAAA